MSMGDELNVKVTPDFSALETFSAQLVDSMGKAVKNLNIAKVGQATGGTAGVAGAAMGGAMGAGIMKLVDILTDFPAVVAVMKLLKLILTVLLLPLVPILKPVLTALAAVIKWLMGGSLFADALKGALLGPLGMLGNVLDPKTLEDFKAKFEEAKGLFSNVGKWIWDNVLLPLGGLFAAIGRGLWGIILKGWDVLKNVGMWLWNNAILPAWQTLMEVGRWIWEQVLLPAWSYLKDVGLWIWEQVLKPAWNVFVNVKTWIWDEILKPAFSVFSNLKKWIWDDLLKKAWDDVYSAIKGVIDRIKSLADKLSLKGMGGAVMEGMGSFFKKPETVSDFILTPGGVLQTNPNDFLIGTKNPKGLGGGNTTININNPTVRSDNDIRVLVSEIEKRLNMEMRRRVSYV
jgi:hypothetical protein